MSPIYMTKVCRIRGTIEPDITQLLKVRGKTKGITEARCRRNRCNGPGTSTHDPEEGAAEKGHEDGVQRRIVHYLPA